MVSHALPNSASELVVSVQHILCTIMQSKPPASAWRLTGSPFQTASASAKDRSVARAAVAEPIKGARSSGKVDQALQRIISAGQRAPGLPPATSTQRTAPASSKKQLRSATSTPLLQIQRGARYPGKASDPSDSPLALLPRGASTPSVPLVLAYDAVIDSGVAGTLGLQSVRSALTAVSAALISPAEESTEQQAAEVCLESRSEVWDAGQVWLAQQLLRARLPHRCALHVTLTKPAMSPAAAHAAVLWWSSMARCSTLQLRHAPALVRGAPLAALLTWLRCSRAAPSRVELSDMHLSDGVAVGIVEAMSVIKDLRRVPNVQPKASPPELAARAVLPAVLPFNTVIPACVLNTAVPGALHAPEATVEALACLLTLLGQAARAAKRAQAQLLLAYQTQGITGCLSTAAHWRLPWGLAQGVLRAAGVNIMQAQDGAAAADADAELGNGQPWLNSARTQARLMRALVPQCLAAASVPVLVQLTAVAHACTGSMPPAEHWDPQRVHADSVTWSAAVIRALDLRWWLSAGAARACTGLVHMLQLQDADALAVADAALAAMPAIKRALIQHAFSTLASCDATCFAAPWQGHQLVLMGAMQLGPAPGHADIGWRWRHLQDEHSEDLGTEDISAEPVETQESEVSKLARAKANATTTILAALPAPPAQPAWADLVAAAHASLDMLELPPHEVDATTMLSVQAREGAARNSSKLQLSPARRARPAVSEPAPYDDARDGYADMLRTDPALRLAAQAAMPMPAPAAMRQSESIAQAARIAMTGAVQQATQLCGQRRPSLGTVVARSMGSPETAARGQAGTAQRQQGKDAGMQLRQSTSALAQYAEEFAHRRQRLQHTAAAAAAAAASTPQSSPPSQRHASQSLATSASAPALGAARTRQPARQSTAGWRADLQPTGRVGDVMDRMCPPAAVLQSLRADMAAMESTLTLTPRPDLIPEGLSPAGTAPGADAGYGSLPSARATAARTTELCLAGSSVTPMGAALLATAVGDVQRDAGASQRWTDFAQQLDATVEEFTTALRTQLEAAGVDVRGSGSIVIFGAATPGVYGPRAGSAPASVPHLAGSESGASAARARHKDLRLDFTPKLYVPGICTSLQVLDLRNTGVHAEGAAMLLQAMCCPPQALHTLLLDDCRLDDVPALAGAIHRAVKSCKRLRHLSLQRCGVGPCVAGALSSALSDSELSHCRLDYNQLGFAATMVLLAAAKHCASLQCLGLTNCAVSAVRQGVVGGDAQMAAVWRRATRLSHARASPLHIPVEEPELLRMDNGAPDPAVDDMVPPAVAGRWHVEASLWSVRQAETESGDYIDGPDVLAKAFENDWGCGKWARLLPSSAARACVKQVMAAAWPLVREAYRWWCVYRPDTFGVALPDWTAAWTHAGLVGAHGSAAQGPDLDNAFVAATFQAAENRGDTNPANALVRFEWLEAVTRSCLLACPAARGASGVEYAQAVGSALTRVWIPAWREVLALAPLTQQELDVTVALPDASASSPAAAENAALVQLTSQLRRALGSASIADWFRSRILYSAPVDVVLREYLGGLLGMFRASVRAQQQRAREAGAVRSTSSTVGMSESLQLGSVMAQFQQCGMVPAEVPAATLSAAFAWSGMSTVDELAGPSRTRQASAPMVQVVAGAPDAAQLDAAGEATALEWLEMLVRLAWTWPFQAPTELLGKSNFILGQCIAQAQAEGVTEQGTARDHEHSWEWMFDKGTRVELSVTLARLCYLCERLLQRGTCAPPAPPVAAACKLFMQQCRARAFANGTWTAAASAHAVRGATAQHWLPEADMVTAVASACRPIPATQPVAQEPAAGAAAREPVPAEPAIGLLVLWGAAPSQLQLAHMPGTDSPSSPRGPSKARAPPRKLLMQASTKDSLAVPGREATALGLLLSAVHMAALSPGLAFVPGIAFPVQLEATPGTPGLPESMATPGADVLGSAPMPSQAVPRHLAPISTAAPATRASTRGSARSGSPRAGTAQGARRPASRPHSTASGITAAAESTTRAASRRMQRSARRPRALPPLHLEED